MVSRRFVSFGLPGDIVKTVKPDVRNRGCNFGKSEKGQYNLKIVGKNNKRLYEIVTENSKT